jgi:hypothetical protein
MLKLSKDPVQRFETLQCTIRYYFYVSVLPLRVTHIPKTGISKCLLIKPINTQYKIHINNRETTPICFGKSIPSLGVIMQRLKPATNGEIIFAKMS